MQFANPITDSAFRLRCIFIGASRVVTVNTRLSSIKSGRGGKPFTIAPSTGVTLDVIYSSALTSLMNEYVSQNDALRSDDWSEVAAALLAGLTLGADGSGPITLTLVGTGCEGYTPPGVLYPIVYVG